MAKASSQKRPLAFIWHVLNKTNNSSKCIVLVCGCIIMGALSYHNMLMWSHYNQLLTGTSLDSALKFCQLLTLHLGIYTLVENIIYQGLVQLSVDLSNHFTLSLHKKVNTASVKSLASHKNTYAQTIAEDVNHFFSAFFMMTRRLVYGSVVVLGNYYYLTKHKALGVLYVCLGTHILVTLANTILSQGWSKNAPSQLKFLEGLKTTRSKLRSHADKFAAQANNLSCLTAACSWEAAQLKTLENNRYNHDKSYTFVSGVIDVITKLYNRLQAPIIMGAMLYIKRPPFPLPSIITIGELMQCAQACTQMRFHLSYFYQETASLTKMRSAFQEISKVVEGLNWKASDLQSNQQVSYVQALILLIKQCGLTCIILYLIPTYGSVLKNIYPMETWLHTSFSMRPAPWLAPTGIASIGVWLVGSWMVKHNLKEQWYTAAAALAVSLCICTPLSFAGVHMNVVSTAMMIVNLFTTYALMPIKQKAQKKIKSKGKDMQCLPSDTFINIKLIPCKMNVNGFTWRLSDTVDINPTKSNTTLIHGNNGSGKSSILQYFEYALHNNGAFDSETMSSDRGLLSFMAKEGKQKNTVPQNTDNTRVYNIKQKQKWEVEPLEEFVLYRNDNTVVEFNGELAYVQKMLAYRHVQQQFKPGSLDEIILNDILSKDSVMLSKVKSTLESFGLSKMYSAKEQIYGASGGEQSKFLLTLWLTAATAIPSIARRAYREVSVHVVADEPGHGLDTSRDVVFKKFIEQFHDEKDAALTVILQDTDKIKDYFKRVITVKNISKDPKEVVSTLNTAESFCKL